MRQAALHGDLIGNARRGGPIELGVQPAGQRAETPVSRLAGVEIAVASVFYRPLTHLPGIRRMAEVVEVDRGLWIDFLHVVAQGPLEAGAALVAELHHPLPVLVPSDALGHRPAVLGLEPPPAGIAPAAVGRAEVRIGHIHVKSAHAVGQLLGNQLLHHFQVARIEAVAADRRAVAIACLKFGVAVEETPAGLNHAVCHQRERMFPGFLDGFPQRVAVAQPRRFRQQLRVVVGVITVPRPNHQVLAVRGDAMPHDLAAVELAQ